VYTVSTDEQHTQQQQSAEERLDEARSQRDEQEGTEKPPVTDEHKKRAKEMAESYEDDRPTVKMPGTGGTVAGTAVSDWIDEDKKNESGADKER
jgi:hypothetical protein